MLTGSGKVRCLFGTDGVRDVANRGMMTPEMALHLARAFVWWLVRGGASRPRVVVGRDTRRSGEMLEAATLAGLMSAGADALTVGVLPTPGVSFAIGAVGASGGVVISASHNPAEYNGIKFFDAQGCKLSDEDEAAIEEFMDDHLLDDWRPTGASTGISGDGTFVRERYRTWLEGLVGEHSWTGRLVVDCAHGAATPVAGTLFSCLGGDAVMTGDRPDGLNINEDVGVMHLPHLVARLKEHRGDLGLAFDGDADRVLFVDRQGRTLDGDVLLWVLARWMRRRGTLGAGVVATVMSNLALEEHLAAEQIPVFRCPVGDRYVLETMKREGSQLGGEQSGHIIVREFASTGDGLCAGLLFLRACRELGEDTDTLVDRFARYPQILRNLHVRDKRRILEDRGLQESLSEAEARMQGKGRIVVRPSGTEPLVRLLVEAKDPELVQTVSDELEARISMLNAEN